MGPFVFAQDASAAHLEEVSEAVELVAGSFSGYFHSVEDLASAAVQEDGWEFSLGHGHQGTGGDPLRWSNLVV